MDVSHPSVRVQVNGEAREVPAGQPLQKFVADLGFAPQTVLVELNGRALLRAEWDGLTLSEGDALEILRVVAGG